MWKMLLAFVRAKIRAPIDEKAQRVGRAATGAPEGQRPDAIKIEAIGGLPAVRAAK
jgi:hypothetical protein